MPHVFLFTRLPIIMPELPLPPTNWRLILSPSADGAYNMALDQAIGEAVAAGSVPPTLRFYGWHPPCVSLGQAQSAETINLNHLNTNGWQLVRRATGGRAVLHHNELTYSIAAPLNEPRVKGGVLASYKRLSSGLLSGLQMLGAQPRQATRPAYDTQSLSAACFDVASDYELTVNGCKLIGSAQMRARNLVLQHGSIPLGGDIAQLADCLNLPAHQRDAVRARLQSSATTLMVVMGRVVDSAELIQHLTNGFTTALNLTFTPAPPSAQEQARAAQLRAAKFANAAWTYRK